ncbi:MAG: hypothetical protein LBE85_10570 [Candidatus Accumulibacter sp.]|jgi:hypothetical protein|nr:hypothetical protein [Accumulibacter sp.]
MDQTIDREQIGRKIDVEIAKLLAETAKIHEETRWYPFIAGAGAGAALLAAAIGLIKLFAS